MKTTEPITITINSRNLKNFDEMAKQRLIPRSSFINALMEQEFKKWSGQ
jgi:metal-responsive CopG/Arc/MetJ family transcriptional regulator